jgi:hypothetical protein
MLPPATQQQAGAFEAPALMRCRRPRRCAASFRLHITSELMLSPFSLSAADDAMP